MTDRDVLLDQVNTKAVVRGRVLLASGREADYYVDMRRVTLDALAAPAIGKVMLDLTADWDFEAVGGLTLGADPVAVAMMHQAAAPGRRLDAFVIRKEQKVHGLQKLIEGPPSPVAGCWPSRTPRPPEARCSRRSGRCARRVPRWSASRWWSTATPGRARRVEAQGLEYRYAVGTQTSTSESTASRRLGRSGSSRGGRAPGAAATTRRRPGSPRRPG